MTPKEIADSLTRDTREQLRRMVRDREYLWSAPMKWLVHFKCVTTVGVDGGLCYITDLGLAVRRELEGEDAQGRCKKGRRSHPRMSGRGARMTDSEEQMELELFRKVRRLYWKWRLAYVLKQFRNYKPMRQP